jgi:hypothetical protein
MPLKKRHIRSSTVNSKIGGETTKKKKAESTAATDLGKQKAFAALSEHENRNAQVKNLLDATVLSAVDRPECTCSNCSSVEAVLARRISAKDLSKGELRLASKRAAEIRAHGQTPATLAKDAIAQLRRLISSHAVYITYIVPEAPGPPAASPTLAEGSRTDTLGVFTGEAEKTSLGHS